MLQADSHIFAGEAGALILGSSGPLRRTAGGPQQHLQLHPNKVPPARRPSAASGPPPRLSQAPKHLCSAFALAEYAAVRGGGGFCARCGRPRRSGPTHGLCTEPAEAADTAGGRLVGRAPAASVPLRRMSERRQCREVLPICLHLVRGGGGGSDRQIARHDDSRPALPRPSVQPAARPPARSARGPASRDRLLQAWTSLGAVF